MNIAIIFAGGTGKRMKNDGAPKQFLNLFGEPILVHTVKKFQNSPLVDKIIIVMLSDYINSTKDLMEKYSLDKVISVVPGGGSGQESIYNGLDEAVRLFGDNNIVLIHDGVRPYFENDLIGRCIDSVKRYGSAISVSPSNETVACVKNNEIVSTTIRSESYFARAPQCFYLSDIYNSHLKARNEGVDNIIDSCSMMLKYGDKTLHTVQTCPENIKITTPIDYYLMRAIIEAQDGLEAPRADLGDFLK